MHFKYPFAFSDSTNHVEEVEQDTLDDVVGCITVAFLTEYGYRPEVPTYGIPDILFDMQPIKLTDLVTAVEGFEPRAALLLSQQIDQGDSLIDRVEAVVSLRSVAGQ